MPWSVAESLQEVAHRLDAYYSLPQGARSVQDW
jgi:hypothetical protein